MSEDSRLALSLSRLSHYKALVILIWIIPIQIERPEVIEQVQGLASLTGVSLTDAVANAVRSQLAIE